MLSAQILLETSRNGRRRERVIQPCRSFLLQLIQLLYNSHAVLSVTVNPILAESTSLSLPTRATTNQLRMSAPPGKAILETGTGGTGSTMAPGMLIGILIGTGNTPVNANNYDLAQRISVVPMAILRALNGPTTTSVRGTAWDGTYLWQVAGGTTIYKLNPVDGSVVTSFASPDGTPMDIAWDGAYLWLAGDTNNRIYKINPANGSVVTYFSSPGSTPSGLTFDGSYLWHTDTANNYLYKINPANGSVVSQVLLPKSVRALAWDAARASLWGTYYYRIVKIDTSTGALTDWFYLDGYNAWGIEIVGNVIWTTRDANQPTIHKRDWLPPYDIDDSGNEVLLPQYTGGEGRMKIRRHFMNNSGGTITVREVGLASGPNSILIARDVLATPINWGAGETLKVEYDVKIVV